MAFEENDDFKKTIQFYKQHFKAIKAYLTRYHVWFRPIAEIPM